MAVEIRDVAEGLWLWRRVIVSHGEPVHDRAAYEHALTVYPWTA